MIFFGWLFIDRYPLGEESSLIASDAKNLKVQSTGIDTSALPDNSASQYNPDPPLCWTDTDYQLWREGRFYPPSQPKGSIIFMVMTGEAYLRTRCDVIMCTFGVTLQPSRLFFVGETSSDGRLPIYDVVKPGTSRPVDRPRSMQKLGEGLAMLLQKISQSSDYNNVEWIMVMEDDTFVLPVNLQKVLAEYDSRLPVIIGRTTCGVGFCGGAGYAISRGLFVRLPRFIRKCRAHGGLHQSDQFVPNCIRNKVKVDFINRPEFHSEPPGADPTEPGYRDHPDGFRHAVSYHYIRPAQRYLQMWRLKQAYI